MDDDDALRRKRDAWLSRVLGVGSRATTPPARPKAAPPHKAVRVEGVKHTVALPSAAKPPARPQSHAPITPPDAKPRVFAGPSGKPISVARLPGGGVSYTAPPPPVTEVTFSGGGGKGVALAGAVKALHDSGVLQSATTISGASVGSMTAAMVAAGCTPEEFAEVANDDETTARIVEGTGGTPLGMLGQAIWNTGSPLTGEGLETLVREVLDQTLRKRIVEYMDACGKRGEAADPAVVAIVTRLSGNKTGPTFGDLRKLHAFIPAIKEVVITGTFLKEVPPDPDDEPVPSRIGNVGAAAHQAALGGRTGPLAPPQGGEERGQLYVFDADSEPDLEVAVAVHASASFPKVFKPVDIKLASGIVGHFIDGGVMNNTPTSATLGRVRALDPVPQGRGVTFVFEDDKGVSKDLMAGKVKPEIGRAALVQDWVVDSHHAAADYATNRRLADKPEEIVEVPLKITVPPKKPGGKGHEIDMRGLMNGTMEFNVPMEDRLALQDATEQATLAQVQREQQERSRNFSSESQMLTCIPMAELKALQAQHYEGAAAACQFREQVAAQVTALQALAAKGPQAATGNPALAKALDTLDQLAGDNADFQAHVARELKKREPLDALLEAVRGSGRHSPALDASYAIADTLKVQAAADAILKQLVYPQMTRQKDGSTALLMLIDMDERLRTARSAKDVNEALDPAIKYFAKLSDYNIPKRGHKAFAAALSTRRI